MTSVDAARPCGERPSSAVSEAADRGSGGYGEPVIVSSCTRAAFSRPSSPSFSIVAVPSSTGATPSRRPPAVETTHTSRHGPNVRLPVPMATTDAPVAGATRLMYVGTMRPDSKASGRSLAAVPVVVAALWAGLAGCGNSPLTAAPTLKLAPSSVTVAVGEEAQVGVESNATTTLYPASCRGIADVTDDGGHLAVRGLAPGQCMVHMAAEEGIKRTTASLSVTVIASSIPDAGTPAICAVPVAKVGAPDGRDLYMAYTDVDSGEPNQTCPIHTSTDFRGDITFSFLTGSPGYSIDGRSTYEILSASPATLSNVGATSSATALEGDIITMTFRKRIFADEDASTPPTWTMTFRMAPLLVLEAVEGNGVRRTARRHVRHLRTSSLTRGRVRQVDVSRPRL
jgi:hypothetical protein